MAPVATSSADLKSEGNALVGEGHWREALACYAAALAALPNGEASDSEAAAALRANRSLCYERLRDFDHALAEAEQCILARPKWPKGYFRKASALEGLHRLGDARLALGEAARLAPKSAEIQRARAALHERTFGGGSGVAARVGAALDVLEDCAASPARTLEAAQELCALLTIGVSGADVQDVTEATLRTECVSAFMTGQGSATVLRRQNEMGLHWLEECKNGTTSLLSRIVAATPQLEQEVAGMIQKSELPKRGSGDGDVVCK